MRIVRSSGARWSAVGAVWLLTLGVVHACGSNGEAIVAGGGAPDSGGTGDDALSLADAPDSGFVPAHHPLFPTVPNNGHPMTGPITLVTVLAENDALSTELAAFSDALTASSWWATVASEYGIAPAAKSLHLTGSPIVSNLSTADIASYLESAISDGGPQPNGNTIYLLYLPDDAGFTDLGNPNGYHWQWLSPDAGPPTGDAWATVRRAAPPPSTSEDQLNRLTRTASHEIAEAATDPVPPTGYELLPPRPRWSGSVWPSFGPEVGDLCEQGNRVLLPAEAGFLYQRIWSNQAAAEGGDPCIPHLSDPYYSVSAPQGWYKASAGGTVSIPLTGWSTEPMSDWLLTTQVRNYSTSSFAQAIGVQLQSALGTEQPGGDACALRPAINNGVAASLMVTVPPSALAGDFVVIGVQSLRQFPGCSTPLTSDRFHEWPIGVYVP
jgi:hypothetical protein